MSELILTKSQQYALSAFKEFLEGDEQVFILKGAAGTGKTTLVTEFLKILEERKREYGLMAPTGRAAYIIGSKTGKPAFTIHRSIYGLSKLKSTSQNKEDVDYGGIHLSFGLRSNDAPLNAIYIVDEVSMVSDKFSEDEAFSFGSGCLLTDLFEFVRGRKIVLVGDYAQLPPVGMNFSPALDKDYIEAKFGCKVAEFILREVMRQTHGSVMLSNASKIRDAVERKSFIEFSLDEGKDCIAENIDLLAPYYRLSEKKPSVKAAVIAYSNKQALDYNLAIRRHYYGDAAPRLKAGDLLMICRNSYAYEYELFNGNIIQIEACQPDSEVTTRSIRVKLGKNRIEQVELRFRRAVICFAVRGKRVSLNVTLLDNFLTDSSGSIGGLLASALIVDFNNRLPQNIKSRLSEIRRLLRSKEKLTIEQQEIRDKYIQLLKNDPFYNAVVAKYGYAMTCHKAQGGEWENVFVDMGRFGGTANEDYFRWAYTAITRASKKLYHFRSPDFNYISGLVVEPVSLVANLKVSIHEDSEDFKTSRFSRIKTLAMKAGLDVEENLSVNYQHRVTFTNPDGEFASYSLWYNKKGYSNKEILVKSSSEEMKSLTSGLLEESLFSGDVRPNFQDRPFADKLTQFLMSLFTEYDITLLDITKDQYQDIFHLKTDGFAKMTFYYTAKGNYSYVRLQSTLGNDDSNLNLIRQSLI